MIENLKQIQKLNIELFFNEDTQRQLKNSSESILQERNINPKLRHLISDVTADSFKAESIGRRSLIARELMRHLELFFQCYLNKEELEPKQLLNLDITIDYFKSDIFFKNTLSFPHYTGAGIGYENTSKFFFFALEYIEGRPNKNQLLLALFTSMSTHLNFLAKYSNLAFFKLFKDGVIFQIENETYAVIEKKRIHLGHNNINPNTLTLSKVIDKIKEDNKNEFF